MKSTLFVLLATLLSSSSIIASPISSNLIADADADGSNASPASLEKRENTTQVLTSRFESVNKKKRETDVVVHALV